MVILGTQYAGEMKKGIFTVMHYLMPKRGILSLHSGCNVGKNDDVTLFFGLSGDYDAFARHIAVKATSAVHRHLCRVGCCMCTDSIYRSTCALCRTLYPRVSMSFVHVPIAYAWDCSIKLELLLQRPDAFHHSSLTYRTK